MKKFCCCMTFGFMFLLIQNFTVNAFTTADITHSTARAITSDNQSPTAYAGLDQTVKPGDTVTLNGSGSSDTNGPIASYSWEQKEGIRVTLSNSRAAKTTFVAPDVDDNGTALVFELTVTDNESLKGKDTVIVNVAKTGGNRPPVADAGPGQRIRPGQTATIDGSGSTDPDGGSISYEWTQKSGPAVVLLGKGTAQPTFTAPEQIDDNRTTLVFELVVTDESGLKSSSATTFIVSGPPLINYPTIGGSRMGSRVLATVDPSESNGFYLLLSQQILEPNVGRGRIYMGMEVVGRPGLDGLTWFRPSNDKVPTYLKLVKTPGGFFPGVEEYFLLEGYLTAQPKDLGPFFVGELSDLRGAVLIFTTWYLKEGMEFNADNLKTIQTVMISVEADTDHSVPIPTIGGYGVEYTGVDGTVLYNMNPDFTTGFNLLLNLQAVDGLGKLYVSLEVLGIPAWESLMWFRPSDDQVPPYIVVSKANGELILEPEEDVSYFTGLLSSAPGNLGPFFVGNLERGLVLIFKSWYLRDGDELNNDNLKHIQTVMVAAPSVQTGE